MTRAGRIVGRLGVLALVGVVARAKAEPSPCREDERLSEAAASLLLEGGPLAGTQLMRAARAVGFDGVALHAREGVSEAALSGWLAALAAGGEGTLVCGEARSEHRRLVLASLRGGSLRREGARVYATLEPGFGSPSLVLEHLGGALERVALTRSALVHGYLLSDVRSLRRVQLVAESASGPRPVAELSLDARDRSGEEEAEARAAAVTAASGESSPKGLFAGIGALRRASGVPALRDNRLLFESAARHAERVCKLGRLAHRVDGEDPEVRLRREHVEARGVGEVLARAGSPDAALRALGESPSHRLALTRRDFTDAGLGLARDDAGQVCLVVLLAAWPRRTP